MELLEFTEKTLSDKLAENIVAIDMRGVNPFCDDFVICTARNARHANALAEDLIQECVKNGYNVRTREGQEGSTWILVDLNDVIVHIFTQQAREEYHLEKLWGDRPMSEYHDASAKD